MSSIGSFSFLRMTGHDVPTLASNVDIIDRVGNDGTGYQINAKKAEGIQKFTTEGINLLADANSRADDYAALKGTKVTVVDDQGRSVNNVLIVDVRVLSKKNMLVSAPANNNYLVQAIWILKPTE